MVAGHKYTRVDGHLFRVRLTTAVEDSKYRLAKVQYWKLAILHAINAMITCRRVNGIISNL
jgi:hypothetical protein